MMIDTDLMQLIDSHFPKMSKGHKSIANFIRDNYNEAAFMTAAQIGECLGISESTVVRFATRIGFDGFPEFQRELAEWVKGKFNTVSKVGAKYGRSTQSEILTSVLSGDIEKIQETMGELDPESFELAVDILLAADNVYIMGLRSCEPLANFLEFYLNMVRGHVKLLNTTSVSETFEQMIRISERDCLVAISFPRYSMRTLKVMEFARDRNARIISITDGPKSPMRMYSICNLYAKSEMVSIVDSLVAPLSLINALVVALCLKAPEAVKENLEVLEETWSNYQVYLNDEINFIDDEPMLDYSLKRDLLK